MLGNIYNYHISQNNRDIYTDELDVKVEGNNIIIVAKQTVQESGRYIHLLKGTLHEI